MTAQEICEQEDDECILLTDIGAPPLYARAYPDGTYGFEDINGVREPSELGLTEWVEQYAKGCGFDAEEIKAPLFWRFM